MFSLDIEEWVAADRIACPEHRATWARLNISVADCPISEVYDKEARSVRTGLYLPVYPLAEWIATRWFPLFCEPKVPGKGDERDFRRNHALRSASEGFALPEVTLVSEGRDMRVEWTAVDLPHHGLQFVSSGEARETRDGLKHSLCQFVDRVVQRLDEVLPGHETPLQEEWAGLQALGDEEIDFCETAARLGLDPFSLEPTQEREVMTVHEKIPESLREEFFQVASLDSLDEHRQWIEQSMKLAAGSLSGTSDVLPDLRSFAARSFAVGLPSPLPWQAGYDCAHKLRKYLGLNGAPMSDNDFVEKLGFGAVTYFPNVHVNIDGLVVRDAPTQRGSFVLSGNLSASRRFAYARSLFEYLANPATASLVSRAITYDQRRNRAFAAELLAPGEAIRRRFSGDTVSQERVEEIADEFAVSEYVIRHQIENHRLGRVVTP